MRYRILTTVATIGLSAVSALAQSNIDPASKYSWAENVGWTNCQHDAPNPGDGVFIEPSYLEGFLWAENVGWINLGNGPPADDEHYANVDDTDFGVNLDWDTGELFGYAWGENVGWINFEGGALATPPQPARIDSDCRFHGYAWGENIGWINLDDVDHYVEVATSHVRGDLNCDCALDGADIDAFFLALGDETAYNTAYPDCDRNLADMNNDDAVDGADIDAFFECLGGGACP